MRIKSSILVCLIAFFFTLNMSAELIAHPYFSIETEDGTVEFKKLSEIEKTVRIDSYKLKRAVDELIIPSEVECDGVTYSVIKIDDNFKNFSNIKSFENKKLTLPSTIKYIPNSVFADCVFSEINLPPTLLEIGGNAFNMPVVVHYEVPPMSGGDPGERNEFRDFEGSLIISNFVEKISGETFYYDNFETVTLGKNVKTIESYGFGGINNLICCATTPPDFYVEQYDYKGEIHKYIKSIFNGEKTKLLVPPGCKEIYEQDENWSMVASINEYEYYVNVEFDNIDLVSHKILKGRMFKGQTRTLHPKITWLHEGSSERFRYWSSSDENVATVDQNGVITAKNFGEATITLMIEDERGVPFNCNYDVLVTTSADVDILESDDTDTTVEVFTLNGLKVGDSTDNLPAGFYIVKSAKEAKKICIK